MKQKNCSPRLGEASRKAWTRLGIALRSRVLPALIAALHLLSVGQTPAQTFTTLHNFAGYPAGGGGYSPGGLVLSSNTLYGTTYGDSRDGGDPGTVFAVSTHGTGFTNLHNFAGYPTDGDAPSGVILSGNTLYGTTEFGGTLSPHSGSVFKVSTDGTGFMNLHSFAPISDYGPFINADGAEPTAGLVLSGDTLYGTTSKGGSSGSGTVFALSTNGTGFTLITNLLGNILFLLDGWILSGDTVYGTTGTSVFARNTDGTGFTNLHSFTATHTNSFGIYTNGDGAYPEGGLVLSGNTLYGTAQYGGSSGYGTVFALSTDGTGFTVLYSFTSTTYSGQPVYSYTNSDGAVPQAGLTLSGNTLYGTTSQGGSSGSGTVFSLSFQPQLTITPSGIPPSEIILSWPTNVAGFDYTGYRLQSTTNLLSPAAWVTNAPAPVVVAGRNTVTNPITGAQQFYRLVQ